jgi:hypothetical protein
VPTDRHPAVHIYTLSRLVHSPAAGWEKQIAKIEAGQRKAYAYYLPMREAVVRFCSSDGRGSDAIVKEMRRRAEQMIDVNAASLIKYTGRLR